jgi:hypothetical protein
LPALEVIGYAPSGGINKMSKGKGKNRAKVCVNRPGLFARNIEHKFESLLGNRLEKEVGIRL